MRVGFWRSVEANPPAPFFKGGTATTDSHGNGASNHRPSASIRPL
ncbi:hypothetical protein [Lysobacter gummosus]